MNNELIKITTNEEGKKLVSARELYFGLGMDTKKWSRWRETNIVNNEYFKENEDWTSFPIMVNGNETVDFAISLEFAKHLAMMSRTEKSHEYRKYFIECEKQLKETQNKAQLLLAIYNGGQEGVLASKQLTEIEVREATKPLLDKIEEDKPLVNFSNTVLKSSDNILVRELSKLAFDEGIKIGEKKLYNKLREWKYIMKDSTEPYQSAMNQGLFVVEEKPINTAYGTKLSRTTKVTPKGQVFIIEKLKKLHNK